MTPIISIKNLSQSYGNNLVLDNINLDIVAGEIIGYIGPNGAGKSTTVKVLCGLINDFKGVVKIKGLNIKNNLQKVKQHIGYIPEFMAIYDNLTPNEYLDLIGSLYKLPPKVIKDRTFKILELFGLQNYIDNCMNTFSKGMKQKVLITAGILHNPDIIIMDEPLNGLDTNSVITIKNLLSELANHGKTIFYCSHMMDVVEKVCNRIILINNGKTVADGKFEDLCSKTNDDSLENLFSRLTSNDKHHPKDKISIIDIFNDHQGIIQ